MYYFRPLVGEGLNESACNCSVGIISTQSQVFARTGTQNTRVLFYLTITFNVNLQKSYANAIYDEQTFVKAALGNGIWQQKKHNGYSKYTNRSILIAINIWN